MYNVFFAELRSELLSPLALSILENMNGVVTTEKVVITVIVLVAIVLGFCMVVLALFLRAQDPDEEKYEYKLSPAEMSKLFD